MSLLFCRAGLRRLVAVSIGFALVASADATQIVYVNQASSSPTQNGASWNTPYKKLQDAIAAVSPSQVNTVEIWVAKGTYTPTDLSAGRGASFQLKSHLRILGGFAGNESSDAHRLLSNVTVLSGDIGTPMAAPVTPQNAFIGRPALNVNDPGFLDNSLTVVLGSNVIDVVLDNLVIANGNAGGVSTYTRSNMIYMVIDKQIGTNISFGTHSDTIVPMDPAVMGGGLFFRSPSMRFDLGDRSSPDLILSSCYFYNNFAEGYGGGAAVIDSFAQLGFCEFTDNHCGYDGGAWYGYNQVADVFETSFTDNSAEAGGGAMVYHSYVSKRNLPPSYDELLGFDIINGMINGAQKLAKVLIKRPIKILRTDLIESLPKNQMRCAKAYGYVALAVQFGDIGYAMAEAMGADTDNEAAMVWREFSYAFNMYCTPEGWTHMFVYKVLGFNDEPSKSQMAYMIRGLQEYMYDYTPPSILRFCRFENNKAIGDGGAIQVERNNMHIEGCDFIRNEGENGGALDLSSFTIPIVMNCVFDGNRGGTGHSAIGASDHAKLLLINSTLVNNTSSNAVSFALGNELGTQSRVFNCIFWGNTNGAPENLAGGADIFTTTHDILATSTEASKQYDAAGAGYVDFIATCDIRDSVVQSLQRMPVGTLIMPLFQDRGHYSQEQIDDVLARRDLAEESGMFESYGFFNVGDGNIPGFKTDQNNTDINPRLNSSYMPADYSTALNRGNIARFNNSIYGSRTGTDIYKEKRVVGLSIDAGAVERQPSTAPSTNAPVITRVYVNIAATGNGSGTNWANAMTDLTAAFAMTNVEIWVAKGTYKPSATGDRQASFMVDNRLVSAYGGFNGTETDRSKRDPAANITILSGNIGDPNISSDNSYSLVRFLQAEPNCELDGFTVRDANGASGGGLDISGCSPSISRCIFVNNSVGTSGGGGTEISGELAHPLIGQCSFISNSAPYGGGAYITYQAKPVFWNCSFVGNTARYGGAVAQESDSEAQFATVLFSGNSANGAANSAGGAFYVNLAKLTLYHCTLAGNQVNASTAAALGGGGIYFTGARSLTLANTIAWGNNAVNSGTGGVASVERRQANWTADATMSAQYSMIEGLSELAGNYNSAGPAYFEDALVADYHLKAESPAVDGGIQLANGYISPTDLDGNARVANKTVDMGAYEFQGTPSPLATRVSIDFTCGGGPTLTLKLTNSTTVLNNPHWQRATSGTNFVNFSADAQHSGVTTTVLTITQPLASMNGWQYRLVDNSGFASQSAAIRASQATLYVKPGGGGLQNGSSWADAFANPESALSNAAPCTEIWVAQGTYTPPATNFHLRPGVSVYGGFAGTETLRTQRDPWTRPTVLSGDTGTVSLAKYLFLNDGLANLSPLDENALLDGFTLMGASDALMRNEDASPAVANCVLIHGGSYAGSGILNRGTSKPTLTANVLVRAPGPACTTGGEASFRVDSTDLGAETFSWQVKTGATFESPTVNTTYQPIHSITSSATVSTFVIVATPANVDAHRFRFLLGNHSYTSPAVRILPATPQRIYVRANATGLNNGTSWSNAYTSLHFALDTAPDCASIWVAEGTYHAEEAYGFSLKLRSGFSMYGGFAGNEATLAARDPAAHPTRLVPLNGAAIFHHDGTFIAVDSSALLDGFVLSGDASLGLIVNYGDSPTIRNCRFENADVSGIFQAGGELVVQQCVFSNVSGGAISGYKGVVRALGCTFEDNRGDSFGGAITMYNGARLFTQDSIFRRNVGAWAGGVYFSPDSTGVIDRCRFEDNSSGGGGAIHAWQGAVVEVRNSLMVRNASSFHGGAVNFYGATLNLINVTMADNTSAYAGAGIDHRGGSVNIVNSILWGNRASGADAGVEAQQILAQAGSTVAVSNTIVEGLATLTGASLSGYHPLFLNAATNDYRIGAQSPAKDTGLNAANTDTGDLIQQARTFGGTIDRGAYESQTIALPQMQVLELPASGSVCEFSPITFTLRAPAAATNAVTWKVLSGSNYVTLASDSTYTLSSEGGTSKLSIGSAPLSLNGAQYQVAFGALGTVPFSLTVLPPRVLRVNAAATNSGNGASWSNAFASLDAALAQADACTEIWVAQGVYRPLAGGSGTWGVTNGTRVLGGFTGSETNRDQRNATTHVTTLRSRNDKQLFLWRGFFSPIGRTTLLEGFTLDGEGSAARAMEFQAASPVLRDLTVSNFTDRAILLDFGSSARFENCRFNDNGGAVRTIRSDSEWIGCTFSRNGPNSYGGAMWVMAGSPRIEDCTFADNESTSVGGAIAINAGSPSIARCVFTGNHADNEGGAIWVINDHTEVINSLFRGNSAGTAGGVIMLTGPSADVAVRNCTITGNRIDQWGETGGLLADQGQLTVVNSILWANTDPYNTSVEPQQIGKRSGSLAVSYTLVDGLATLAGASNRDGDPLFADPDADNYRLSTQSPLINAGTNSIANGTTDLAGSNRVVGASVDIGAYEQQGTNAVSPVALARLPLSQTVCENGEAVFTLDAGNLSPTNFIWQRSTSGTNFVDFSGNAEHVLTTNGTLVELTIAVATQSLAGERFRIRVPGLQFVSAPFSLYVSIPDILYVDGSASGSGAGDSWSNAYTSLSRALDAADSCTRIWVADGTYTPELLHGSRSFELRPHLEVLGGFAGGETSLTQRNWSNNVAVLVGRPDAETVGNYGYYDTIDRTALLDGFVVRPSAGHACVINLFASPTLRNLTLRDSTYIALINQYGNPLIENCVFESNTQYTAFTAGGSALFRGCVFRRNTATEYLEGSVFYAGSSTLQADNCVFEDNQARDEMVSLSGSVTARFTRCVFRRNRSDFGSGVGTLHGDDVAFVNCVFNDNDGWIGGALRMGSGSAKLLHCTFVGNTSLYNAGGIYQSGGSLALQNSVLWENRDNGANLYDAQVQGAGTRVVTNCIVEGWSGDTNGLIGYAPLFLDPTTENYGLMPQSPGVERGSDALAAGVTNDFTGGPRLRFSHVDLGAYESLGTASVARMLVTPRSTETCVGDVATFHAQKDPATAGSNEITWQFNYNGFWQTFTPSQVELFGPPLGTYTVSTNAGVTTLTVSELDPGMDGYKFRSLVAAYGLTNAPARLGVTPESAIFVDAAAPTNGTGRSWAAAFRTIGSAIAAANECRRMIWVKEGIYNESVALPPSVSLYGGFAGTETSLTQRAWQAHPTIVQQSGTYAVTIDGNVVPSDRRTLLDGFYLQRTGSTAMLVYRSAPTIRNCVFRNSGQGIALTVCTALVERCVFENNSGEGLHISEGNPEIRESIFRGNGSYGINGSSFGNATTSTVINCLVSGNGGGVSASSGLIINFYHTAVVGNRASLSFGSGANTDVGGTLRLYNSILWGNRTPANYGHTLEEDQISTNNSVIQAFYTTIEGLNHYAGNQNDGKDPLFVYPVPASLAPTADGDYHLQPCSPMQGNGFTSYASGITNDLDLLPRFVGASDRGPYEIQVTNTTALFITLQPSNLTFCAASLNRFRVTANGAGKSYHWEVDRHDGSGFLPVADGGVVSGSADSNLYFSANDLALNGQAYRCRITTTAGCDLVSLPATLTMLPSIWYVNINATGSGSGTSWSNAFTNIRTAITNPLLDACGSEIWVAKGTYIVSYASTDWIDMPNNLSVYGGFTGSETNRAQRDWKANRSALQGGTGGENLLVLAGWRLVFNGTNTVATETPRDNVRIDGLVLRNANTGVELIDYAEPVIENCTFEQCDHGIGASGAAIDARNCRFIGNGTGTYCWPDTHNGPPMNSGRFEHNYIGCVFQAQGGDGIAGAGDLRYVLRNCLVTGNGGRGVADQFSDAYFYNCTVAGNGGGGVSASGKNFYNSVVVSNHTQDISGSGFGAYNTLWGTNAQPQFVAGTSWTQAPTTNGDFRVLPCSPAINGGNNAYLGWSYYKYVDHVLTLITNTIATDLDGNARVLDTTVDIGAYEANGLQLRIVTQPTNYVGSYGTPVTFTVAVNKAPVSYQWQAKPPVGSYTDITNGPQYSGTASSALTISKATTELNGYSFRCRVTDADGCPKISNAGVYTHVDVGTTLVGPKATLTNAPGSQALAFQLGTGIDPQSVSADNFVVQEGYRGRLRSVLGDVASITVTGNTVTLLPASPFLAGEQIQVSAASSIKNTNGFGMQPFVWSFLTAASRSSGPRYQRASYASARPEPADFLAFDPTRDAALDLALGDEAGLASLAHTNGAGLLTAATLSGAAQRSLARADLNGDGYPDLVADGTNGAAVLWLSSGANLAPAQTITGTWLSVAAGDIDGDGDNDLLLVGSEPAQIWFNNGSGVMADSGQRLGSPSGARAALIDFNNDGALDALVGMNGAASAVQPWQNNKLGLMSAKGPALNVGDVQRILVADLTGDGSQDFIVALAGKPAELWSNDGSGNFSSRRQLNDVTQPGDTAVTLFGQINPGHEFIPFNDDLNFPVWSFGSSWSFKVTPVSGPSVCRAFSLTSSPDNWDRAPYSIYISGLKNPPDNLNPWQVLASYSPYYSGPRETQYFYFTNDTTYAQYRFDMSDNLSVELVEMELLTVNPMFGSNECVDVALADLNADGRNEILTLGTDSVVHVWQPTTGGLFTAGTSLNIPGAMRIEVADFDGDNDLDLAAGIATGGVVVLMSTDFTGAEDAPLVIDPAYFTTVFAGASRQTLNAVRLSGLPTHGTLYQNGSAVSAGAQVPVEGLDSLSYSAATNYNGSDSFAWQGVATTGLAARSFVARIDLTNSPDAALASDDTVNVVQGTATNELAHGGASLLANDDNMDGLPLTLTIVDAPTSGTASVHNDGTFLYTHDNSESRADSFTYREDNGFEGISTATVWITVLNRPDAPTNVLLSHASVYETDPPGTVVGFLSAEDPDWDDAHAFSLVIGPGDDDNAAFAVISNALVTASTFDFAAQSTYSVRLRATDLDALTVDRQFNISIRTEPVASNFVYRFYEYLLKPTPIYATDEDGDTLTYLVVTQAQRGLLFDSPTNTDWTYYPVLRPGYDSFAYAASDGARTSAVATVDILADLPPYIDSNSAYNVEAGVPYAFTPYHYDPDGDGLTYDITAPPAHGVITNAGPDFTYTATAGYGGPDQFTFTATDPYGAAATGTVALAVENYHRLITNAYVEGAGTLASAISEMAANLHKPWFIEIAPTLAGQTITLTNVTDTTFGPTAIPVYDQIRFHGTGATGLVLQIDPSVTMRFFRVMWNASLDLRDVELRGGRLVGADAAPELQGETVVGAAILNYGTSELQRVTMRECSVQGGVGGAGTTNSGGYGTYGGAGLGAAIANFEGCVIIDDSAFIHCTATGGPGGPGDTPIQDGQSGNGIGGALFNQQGYARMSGSRVESCGADLGSACALVAYSADSVLDLEQTDVVALSGGPALYLQDSYDLQFHSYAYPPAAMTGTVDNGECAFTLFRPPSQWTVTGVSTATHGTIAFTATNVIYTAGPSLTSIDQFDVTITGPRGSVTNVPATIYLITGPEARDDAVTLLPGQTVNIPVLTNDYVGSYPPIEIYQAYGASYGNVYPNGSGDLVYQPFGFVESVTDTVTYVIRDANLQTSTATVSIVIRSTTLLVYTNAPSGPGSVAEALITTTNPLSFGRWTIEFAPGMAGQTLTLPMPFDPADGGSGLRLTTPLILTGEKAPGLAIARATNAPPMRLFSIDPGIQVTLRALTLANGYVDATNGSARGGAILNRGSLSLDHVRLVNNRAVGDGLEEARGGAIFNDAGSVDITSSHLEDNAALGGRGGAVFNYNGVAFFQSCIIQSNSAAQGGGLFSHADGGNPQAGFFACYLDNPDSGQDFEALAESGGSSLFQVYLSSFHTGPRVMSHGELQAYTSEGGTIAMTLSPPLGDPGDQQAFALSIDPSTIPDSTLTVDGTGAVRTITYTTEPGIGGMGIVACAVMDGAYSYMHGLAVPIAPAAVADIVELEGAGDLHLPVADVLSNDRGTAGDPPQVVSVTSPSAQGGDVTLSAGEIIYTPPGTLDGPDQFDYTISDSSLRSSSAGVSVLPSSMDHPAVGHLRASLHGVLEEAVDLGVTSVVQHVSTVLLEFGGIPFRVYRLDASVNPGGPWTTESLASADDAGRVYYFVTTPAGVSRRYYRTVDVSP